VSINLVTIVHQPACKEQRDSDQIHFHKIFTNFTKVLLKFVDKMQFWLKQ